MLIEIPILSKDHLLLCESNDLEPRIIPIIVGTSAIPTAK